MTCSMSLSLPQTGFLILIAAMLVARTYCDVWMIQNGTMIERSEVVGTQPFGPSCECRVVRWAFSWELGLRGVLLVL